MRRHRSVARHWDGGSGHIIFGEDGNAVVITQSLSEYELFGYDVVEDMSGH